MAEMGDAHGDNVPTRMPPVARVPTLTSRGHTLGSPAGGRGPAQPGQVWPPTLRGMPDIDAHNGVAS